MHAASNRTNEKKCEFYRGYKNHVLVDCISGLPIHETTTTAETADSSIALDILADTRRGCTKYITLPDDLRLSIDRNSKYFKSSYSLRTECERYNSRFKSTGQERMWVRDKSSVSNLNTLAHISLLAVAVAAIAMPDSQSYRKLKTAKSFC